METAKLTARGQTTIPKRIRAEAGFRAGDLLAFEIERDRLIVRRGAPARDDYLAGLERTLSEWASPEDEDAWNGL